MQAQKYTLGQKVNSHKDVIASNEDAKSREKGKSVSSRSRRIRSSAKKACWRVSPAAPCLSKLKSWQQPVAASSPWPASPMPLEVRVYLQLYIHFYAFFWLPKLFYFRRCTCVTVRCAFFFMLSYFIFLTRFSAYTSFFF